MQEKSSTLNIPLEELKLVGITGSTTSTSEAPLILVEGMEREVREEDVVLIENLNGGLILAVCRGGLGIDDNLRVGSYSPGIAYVRSTGKSPSRAKESYHFMLSFIGAVADGRVKPNDVIVAPGSRVYAFRGTSHNPLQYLKTEKTLLAGYLVREPSWDIPFDAAFIPYHIGVFGATGSGKSYLTRHLLIPVLLKAGYGVLDLDWAGVDYAPYFEESQVIPISEVESSPEAFLSYLMDRTRNFGYRGETSTLSMALEEVLSEHWQSLVKEASTPSELLEKLKDLVNERLKGQPKEGDQKSKHWIDLASMRLERGLSKLPLEEVETFMGKVGIKDLIPRQGEVSVVDMHRASDVAKLTFFLTLSNELLTRMYRGEMLNLALVIDEAPQYCPHEPRGVQVETTDRIKDLCALGRKHRLCVVLISQGIAGEIGINAAIRRNLNTQFIGQIHPLDLEEAGKRLSPYGIKPESLLYLEPGQFYFVGKMNPSPTPLLISFQVAS
ncbi:MAG: hypothetical protein DRJ98_01700 [Thermoprotei archaeon]|nr:MAG: hypothetical protein DRJ98_01700 [Thermoprotei archaeon]